MLVLIFFYFGLLKNQEMNPVETYFHDLALSSRASLVGVTHEGVVLCALARLMGPTHAQHAKMVSVVPR
jgi:hypothetical protein